MRRSPKIFCKSLIVCCAVALGIGPWSATRTIADDLSRSQKIELRNIRRSIDSAEQKFTSGNLAGSARDINNAIEQTKKLLATVDIDSLEEIKKQYNRLAKAHEMLTRQKQKLSELPELKAGEKSATAKPDEGKPDGISFVKQVVPILAAKCGRCHVTGSRGNFSMATYETLMRGPRGAKVVFANKPDDSRMIEVIEEGDMPRGGLTITKPELATLKKWIAEGAKFDGENPAANLAQLAPQPSSPRQPRLQVNQAKGSVKISFAGELAPVIVEKCSGCHLNTQRVRGGLNMSDFRGFLRGGDNGPMIKPGDGKNSLLVQRLRGDGGGQRMPAGSPPLKKEFIEKFITWIDEGAPFDSRDPQMPLVQLASVARAKAATHEELSNERMKRAQANWKLVMSDADFTQVATDNFLLIGEMDEATLKSIGSMAEKHAKKIAPLLKKPGRQPLIKGRMTIFIFKRRYDYSEFGKMIEKRELPRGFQGHWGYSTLDAYAAMLVTRSAENEDISPTLAQQIAAVAMASSGFDVPKWYADGVGYWASARLHSRDDATKNWRKDGEKFAAEMQKPDDFIKGVLPDDQAALVSYYFVDIVNKNASRMAKLMKELQSGKDFEASFEATWGRKPADLINALAKGAGAGKNKSGKRNANWNKKK